MMNTAMTKMKMTTTNSFLRNATTIKTKTTKDVKWCKNTFNAEQKEGQVPSTIATIRNTTGSFYKMTS